MGGSVHRLLFGEAVVVVGSAEKNKFVEHYIQNDATQHLLDRLSQMLFGGVVSIPVPSILS